MFERRQALWRQELPVWVKWNRRRQTMALMKRETRRFAWTAFSFSHPLSL
jgi:hypothetical protein